MLAYPTVPPAKKSPLLGTIALVIVAVAGIGAVVTAQNLGHQLVLTAGPDWATNYTGLTDQQVSELQSPFLIGFAFAVIGIVGWIISIVATATKRGRPMGIAGLILGIVAPIVALMVLSSSVYG